MRLENKIVLITGGASGIGAATARMAEKEGAVVYITDIQDALGQGIAKEIGGTFIHHDVSLENEWAKVMNRIDADHGCLDVLVNNAGIVLGGTIEDTDMDSWNKMIAVNMTGTMLGCREAVKMMKVNPGGPKGSIVNISSITGFIGLAAGAGYSATKGAVRLLTKAAAVHCAREYKNIRCNSVHPGAIDTPMNQASFDASGDPEGMRAFLNTVQPIGRMGSADEIADAVIYLASDGASFVTGTELLVDGGWLAASGPL